MLESRTAALLQPYRDTGECGKLHYPPSQLQRWLPTFVADGWQLHAHSIGDGDSLLTIGAANIFASALEDLDNARPELRHVIAHLQLVRRSDLERLAKLRVGANFTPIW